jgi:hypothetical protein
MAAAETFHIYRRTATPIFRAFQRTDAKAQRLETKKLFAAWRPCVFALKPDREHE